MRAAPCLAQPVPGALACEVQQASTGLASAAVAVQPPVTAMGLSKPFGLQPTRRKPLLRSLPTRYAMDVNIDSLDVLNHKRLLDSARADPSALSFQVRPVDVISAAGPSLHSSRRPSFNSSDTPLQEVRLLLRLHACSATVWLLLLTL